MRGYFGIGIFHTKTEANVGTLMRSAEAFGASFVYTIGRRYTHQSSDTVSTPGVLPCYHYLTFDQFLNHLPFGCRIVAVEISPGAREVGQYCHPDRCVYLLGAEDHGIPEKELDRCHDVIRIPSKRCLNVAVAGSIVLWDRINHFRARKLANAA